MTTDLYAELVCHVNPNLLQKVALLTGGVEQSEPMVSGKRQIFHPEIGRSLAQLREDRDLSQGQVALRARGKISEGTLKAIETGRIKNPDPDHLRTLAAVYGVAFRIVAEPFIRANYGSDLIRHEADQQSGSSSQAGDPINDTTAADRRELVKLRTKVAQQEKENGEVRTLVTTLFEVAVDLRKAAGVKKQRAGGGGRHRETA